MQTASMPNPYQPPQVNTHFAPSGEPDRELPKWIRFFSWIFLLVGPFVFLGSVVDTVRGSSGMTYNFFGWSARGGLDNAVVFLLVALLSLSSIAAYGLLWKRSWGLDVGLLAGLAGLVASAGNAMTVDSGGSLGFHMRLEPVFQIAFVVSLWRRRKAWLGQGSIS